MNEITQFLINHGDPVLFVFIFAEQAGLPLPAAPWLLTAGALSASGMLNAVPAVGITFLACVVADWIWFFIGRRYGQRIMRNFCRLSLNPSSCVRHTNYLFARHGHEALLVAKFLPGLGTVMPPLAGARGMSRGRFLLFDGLGSLLYVTFYTLIGYVFHNQLQAAVAVLNQIGFNIMLLAIVVAVGYVAFKYVRRRGLRLLRTDHNIGQSQGARANHENVAGKPGVDYQSARHSLLNSGGSEELFTVAFPLARSAAATVGSPAPLRQSTPCEL